MTIGFLITENCDLDHGGSLEVARLASPRKRFFLHLTAIVRELSGCVLFKKHYFYILQHSRYVHIKIG